MSKSEELGKDFAKNFVIKISEGNFGAAYDMLVPLEDIEARPLINIPLTDQETPHLTQYWILKRMLMSRQLELFKLSIKLGMNPSASAASNSILDMAKLFKKTDFIEFLESQKAISINEIAKIIYHRSSLDDMWKNIKELAKEHGKQIYTEALTYAIGDKFCSRGAVNHLIEEISLHGSLINNKSILGISPIEYAISQKKDFYVQRLLQHGAIIPEKLYGLELQKYILEYSSSKVSKVIDDFIHKKGAFADLRISKKESIPEEDEELEQETREEGASESKEELTPEDSEEREVTLTGSIPEPGDLVEGWEFIGYS